jgi:hypothetical protein
MINIILYIWFSTRGKFILVKIIELSVIGRSLGILKSFREKNKNKTGFKKKLKLLILQTPNVVDYISYSFC